jgi:hypothetical protein
MPSLTLTSGTEATDSPGDSTPILVAETRDAVRWITALAGVVGAALVAGLQLRDLDKASSTEALMASTAVACALLAVGTVLLSALRVLAAPRRSLRDLAQLEAAGDPLILTRGPAPGPRAHWLVEELRQRRSALLGPYPTLDDAYRASLAPKERVSQQAPAQAEPPSAGREHTEAGGRTPVVAARIESVALSLEVERRFRQMMRVMVVAGGLFVLAVVTFAFLTRSPNTTPDVKSPIAVTVYVPDATSAQADGLPTPCAGRTLSGVAVAGTLDVPIVVTRPNGPCGASRIIEPHHVIVVPSVNP